MNQITLRDVMWVAIICLVLGYAGGRYHQKSIDTPTTSDTTVVVTPVKPPAAIDTTIHGKVDSIVVVTKWRDRPDVVTKAENVKLMAQLDTVLKAREALRAKLDSLLAPHYAVWEFSQKFGPEDKGLVSGTLGMKYTPMLEEFEPAIKWHDFQLPQLTITNTYRPAKWVKPALFVAGAATAYFVQQNNSTGALISTGAGITLIFVEF